MARFRDYVPAGVIPATLIAFNDDMSIDEAETRRHLTYVAGDARHLRDHRQRALLRGACAHLRGAAAHPGVLRWRRSATSVPLINGVYADGSIEAARIAAHGRARGRVGAARVSAAKHGDGRRACGPRWRSSISRASPMPPTCRSSCSSIRPRPASAIRSRRCCSCSRRCPRSAPIKDWCDDAMLHEKHIRTFQSLPRPVNVLTTHSAWLMASLTHGRQRPALRRRQRDRRSAGRAVRRRARRATSPGRRRSTTASIRCRRRSTRRRSSTCTTA